MQWNPARLRKARKEANLSQEKLAAIVFCGGTYAVSNWECGKTKPNIDHLCRFAKALNKPIGYFFEEDEE